MFAVSTINTGYMLMERENYDRGTVALKSADIILNGQRPRKSRRCSVYTSMCNTYTCSNRPVTCYNKPVFQGDAS